MFINCPDCSGTSGFRSKSCLLRFNRAEMCHALSAELRCGKETSADIKNSILRVTSIWFSK